MGKKIKSGEKTKFLYEWAEESFFVDEVSSFLQYCRSEGGYEQIDVISYREFLILKEKFES